MSSSQTDSPVARARDVSVSDDLLSVELTDGRLISAPISWYPRLAQGSLSERSNWRLIGQGTGIHWPDLDEDIAVEDLLEGRRSGESSASVQRWLESRTG
jgi:hypothetical protein